MRITIYDNSELLAGKVLEVNHIFCLRERINTKTASVAHKTDWAYLLKYQYDGDHMEKWVPKKVCRVLELKTPSLERWG